MSGVLSSLSAGFADPVHASQQSFRAVLDAMAQPGTVHEIPAAVLRGLEPPASLKARAPMGVGMAALLLTLLDAETSLGLLGTLRSEAAQTWVRFHCGARTAEAAVTAFIAVRAADVAPALLATLPMGTDEAPQQGATLIVEVPTLVAEPAVLLRHGVGIAIDDDPDLTPIVSLRGPGIPERRRLAIGGVARDFWRQRIALQALFPRGIDLVLTQGTRVAAVPRSTRVELEAGPPSRRV